MLQQLKQLSAPCQSPEMTQFSALSDTFAIVGGGPLVRGGTQHHL